MKNTLKNWLLVSLCFFSVASPAISAVKVNDIVKRCFPDGKVDLGSARAAAFANILADATGVLAKYDLNCTGDFAAVAKQLNNVSGVTSQDILFKERLNNPNQNIITATQLEADLGRFKLPANSPDPTDPNKKFGFYVRDTYSPYSITNPPTPSERAEGAQISWTRDILNHNSLFSATGALIGYYNTGWDTYFGQKVADVTFAGGIELDRVINHKAPKQNADYLGVRAIEEIERVSAYGTEFFRVSPYLKTDVNGKSQIYGSYFEYQFANNDTVAKRIPSYSSPVIFGWTPILHAEIEKVATVGGLTNVNHGDVYTRVGPILQANIWFSDLSNSLFSKNINSIVLEAQYRYLPNLSDGGSKHEIKYFQFTAAYNLDESGNTALSIKYRNGDIPGNGTGVRDVKAGISAKY
jgi:copper chaperone CopZ